MNASNQNIEEKISLLLMNYQNLERNMSKKSKSMQFLKPKALLGEIYSYTKIFYFFISFLLLLLF